MSPPDEPAPKRVQKKPNAPPKPDELKKIFDWFIGFTEHKTALAFAAGIIYVLGYLTWAWHAWRNGLGMLPALEAQYFVAGAVPFIIILLVYCAIRVSLSFRLKYTKWFTTRCLKSTVLRAELLTKKEQWPSLFLLVTPIVLFILLIVSQFTLVPAVQDTSGSSGTGYWSAIWTFYLTRPWGLATSGMAILVLLIWPTVDYQGRGLLDKAISIIRKVRLGIICLYICVLGGAGIFLYLTVLYPVLPQEYGGVRPRAAYLDIVPDQTSANTTLEALTDILPESAGPVFRTEQLDVYFVQTDYILVKKHGQTGQETNTYEIKQSIIKAITWCPPTRAPELVSGNTTSE